MSAYISQHNAVHDCADHVGECCIDWQVKILACLARTYLAPQLS